MVLNKHTPLVVAKRYEALMKTPKAPPELVQIDQGDYLHFGLQYKFVQMNPDPFVKDGIIIDVVVDD